MSDQASFDVEVSAPARPEPLHWRRWPLVEGLPWSLAVPGGVLAATAGASYASSSWLMGAISALLLIVSLVTFLVPVRYDLTSAGVGRTALGRTRVTPWFAFRAYQPRANGLVLFDRSAPLPIDALRAVFLPYGDDPDETLCAVRYYLRHAEELAR